MVGHRGPRYHRPMETPTLEIARWPALRSLAWQLHQERTSP